MKANKTIILVIIASTFCLGSLFVFQVFNKNSNKISMIDEANAITDIYEGNKYTEDGILFSDAVITFGTIDNHPSIEVNNNHNSFSFIDENIEGEIIDIIDKEYFITAIIEGVNGEVEVDYFIAKGEIIPFHKKQLTINYTKGVVIEPKYLVIHETANRNKGANAKAHYNYWSTNKSANASTHFVVDSEEIYQMLDLTNMAWHVGDNKGYSNIYNNNSLGIEICVNEDGNYLKAREYTIALAALLMRMYDMNSNQLKRHFDASGKYCPYYMLEDSSLWDDFVSQVEALL